MADHAVTGALDSTFSVNTYFTVLSIWNGAVTGALSTSWVVSAPPLEGRGFRVSGGLATQFSTPPPTLSGYGKSVSCGVSTEFTSPRPTLLGRGWRVSGGLLTTFRATTNLTGASDTHGVSVCNAMQEICMVWGLSCYKSAPGFAILRAINDLNAALQTVWNRAQERNYWTGVTVTLDIAAGADSHDLDDMVQSVTGPCRLETTKRPLALLGTVGELETFEDLYLDGNTSDEPLAYHIERLAQDGNDPAKCIFRCVPAPAANTSILLDVVMEAPRYTAENLTACPIIPMPHRYVETLLLPIARYRASSFALLAVKQDLMPGILREYQEAMLSLGLADPLPGKAGDNIERREEPKK